MMTWLFYVLTCAALAFTGAKNHGSKIQIAYSLSPMPHFPAYALSIPEITRVAILKALKVGSQDPQWQINSIKTLERTLLTVTL